MGFSTYEKKYELLKIGDPQYEKILKTYELSKLGVPTHEKNMKNILKI
jgi:hypothetical protein